MDADALAAVATYDAPTPPVPDTLTVVTYNLGYLSGMTNNQPVERTSALFDANLEAAVALLEEADADLIALQEIDFGAARSFGVDQLDVLARRLGYGYAARAVNWDERYVPFPSADPRVHFGRVLSGQAVLSRFPIRAHTRLPLARPPAPFYYDAFYLDRLAQVVTVEVSRPLTLVNVHLEAWDAPTRQQQARTVRALADSLARAATVLVLGDFNSILPAHAADVPSEAARLASDPTMQTFLHGGAFVPASPAGPPFTYPADAPRLAIDHVLLEAGEIASAGAFVLDGPRQPSDHRAVAVRLVLQNVVRQ